MSSCRIKFGEVCTDLHLLLLRRSTAKRGGGCAYSKRTFILPIHFKDETSTRVLFTLKVKLLRKSNINLD